MIKEIFVKLKIIQEKKIKNAFNTTYTMRRFNPYNPLTYITLFVLLIIGICMYGIVGVWEQVNMDDLKFKWN
jgi:uncharacterized membrane protein